MYKIFFASLLIPTICLAELVNCNGVWINGPCEATPAEKIKAAEPRELSEEAKIASEKKYLLHKLSTLQFNLKREYGSEFSISSAERVCTDKNSSVIDCENAVNSSEEDLLNKQLTLSKLKEKEKKTDKDGNSVVIVQPVVDDDDYRWGYVDDDDRPSGPTIIDGVRIPAGKTKLNIEKPRDPGNTLIKQPEVGIPKPEHPVERPAKGSSVKGKVKGSSGSASGTLIVK